MCIMDCNAPETSSVHNAPFCACKLWVPGGGRRRAHGQKQREIVGCVKYFTNVCDFINPRDTVPAVVVVNRDDANSTAMRRRHASAPGVPDPLTPHTAHMPRFSSLADADLKPYLGLVEQSLRVRRHVDLLLWLQGDVQRYLPHEIMLAGWGDFRLGMIAHDIVSALPGVRTARTAVESVSPLLEGLFARWIELGRVPYVLRAGESGFPAALEAPGAPAPDGELGRALKAARSALIHGICDERGRHDCLYVLFASEAVHDQQARQVMELLLPYLDMALRQVPQLRTDPDPEADEPVCERSLTDREMEIMAWLKLGKTNHEIGLILDISAFTVKNHLKRIFRKLGVYNRLQAVSRFEAMIANVPT